MVRPNLDEIVAPCGVNNGPYVRGIAGTASFHPARTLLDQNVSHINPPYH